MGAAAAFHAYGFQLELVLLFRYLERFLKVSYDDCQAVVSKFRKYQWKWYGMSRVYGQKGEDDRTSGTFYKVVVQEKLLFGS